MRELQPKVQLCGGVGGVLWWVSTPFIAAGAVKKDTVAMTVS